MVAGLVEQLQTDALDHTVPVSTLLRKVKVCAAKLGLDDALSWVEQELNGYTCLSEDLPEYRQGYGTTMCQDVYARWFPFAMENSDWNDKIAAIEFREPVSNYEDMLKTDGRTFDLPLDNQLVGILNQSFGTSIVAMRNKVSRGHIHGIVERVRTLVLDWSLELARREITGEGMSFSTNEKARASDAHISIGTFTGSFNTGSASGDGSAISQSTVSGQNFQCIAELVESVSANVSDTEARAAILLAANEISGAQDKRKMLAGYERLISAAANHMTVVAPFLPAIAAAIAGS